MFGIWQGFYEVTGEVSATLIGLMFIVTTLMAGRAASAVERGARLFTTPIVFQLASVRVLSVLALMPDGDRRATDIEAATGESGRVRPALVGVRR